MEVMSITLCSQPLKLITMNIKRKVTATYFSCFIRNTKEGEYIPAGGKLNRWVELSSVEATEGYRYRTVNYQV